MNALRRWPVVTAAVLVILFTLYRLNQNVRPGVLPVNTPKPTYTPPSKPNDGRFRWSDYIAQYPISSLTPLPNGQPKRLPKVQYNFAPEDSARKGERLARRDAVKQSFLRCYRSYRAGAWMKDELSPFTGGGRNAFGGWAATLVDSLDTMKIMGMETELDDAIAAVSQIDFTTSTDNDINVFETTIRYLGGFLAAYDLIGDRRLLDKAVEVGEMLLVPFDTPNHMPVCHWDWRGAINGAPQSASPSTLVSELGSLAMEFTRLSQLTGNMRWYDAIQRITDLFDQQQSQTNLPGMWPIIVNARDMNLTLDTSFTLGGMSDSLYEYFPKTYALLGGQVPVYRKLYEQSMATAIQYNFFRPMTPQNDDILVSGNARVLGNAGVFLDPQGQHLTCFAGGMLALAGRLFNLPEHVGLGRKLTDGCVWAYDALPLGIMPETFHLVPCESKDTCTWSAAKWTDGVVQRQNIPIGTPNIDSIISGKRLPPGFTDIGDRRYILRPEAIESVFILYRITGDQSLQDTAWRMFTRIQNVTQTEYGNAAIIDITVNDSRSVSKSNRMESFWMAETLKYFYLIFSEPGLISLDEYVFNTEAHPFRRPS